MKYIKTLIFLLICTFSFGQSTTMETFDKNEGGTHLYFYQSVLRLLNLDKNPDFDRLIKDLEYLKFVMITPESTTMEEYASLEKSLMSEGYEELMAFDRKDYQSLVLENDTNGDSNWMVLFIMDSKVGLIEMHGSLDPRYFTAFSSLDFNKLQGFIPQSLKED